MGASALRASFTVTLPLAAPGSWQARSSCSSRAWTSSPAPFFGVPQVMLPLLLFTASMEGTYQIALITALVLLVPSVGFMLVLRGSSPEFGLLAPKRTWGCNLAHCRAPAQIHKVGVSSRTVGIA
jgi:ABC-type Fe3+ transport system permease subunit